MTMRHMPMIKSCKTTNMAIFTIVVFTRLPIRCQIGACFTPFPVSQYALCTHEQTAAEYISLINKIPMLKKCVTTTKLFWSRNILHIILDKNLERDVIHMS